MGYYTQFTITASPEVEAALIELSGYPHLKDTCKWYSVNTDVREVSARFPTEKIEVFCNGEDGEQWIIWALNGEIEVCNSERVFQPRTLWR